MSKAPVPRKFYTRAEVQEILKVSLATVNRRLRDKTLPFSRFGDRILIPVWFIDQMEAKPAEETAPAPAVVEAI